MNASCTQPLIILIVRLFMAMMTASNGNSFRVTGPLCGELTAQRPVTGSFGVSLDLRLNERLSKQSWGWWFETPLRPLCRHRNVGQLRGQSSSDDYFCFVVIWQCRFYAFPWNSGTCEQQVQSIGLRHRDWDFLFVCALVYCDIKTLQPILISFNIRLNVSDLLQTGLNGAQRADYATARLPKESR